MAKKCFGHGGGDVVTYQSRAEEVQAAAAEINAMQLDTWKKASAGQIRWV